MGRAELHNLIPLGAILHRGAHRPKLLELGAGVRLRKGRMHEVSGASADMFAIQVAAAQDQPVLWIGLRRDIVTLNPTGLQAWLKVEDLILVEAVSRGELLWAADQALRASGGFCVILDMPDTLSLKESRRLQLAAEQGGGIGLLLLRGPASTSGSANALGLRAVLQRTAKLGLDLPERQEWRSWPLAGNDDRMKAGQGRGRRCVCQGYSPSGCRSFRLIA